MSDVMMLCESVLVGVLLECFKLGDDVKMLDLIVGRVKERLAKARLEDLETKGSGWWVLTSEAMRVSRPCPT
jgi:hypothetical protein